MVVLSKGSGAAESTLWSGEVTDFNVIVKFTANFSSVM